MKFEWEMTIAQLVEEMNNGGTQSELYKLSKISKDVIPYLFKAAGYVIEKKKYVANTGANTTILVRDLVEPAKKMQHENKLAKMNKTIKKKVWELPDMSHVITTAEPIRATNTGANTVMLSDDLQQVKEIVLDSLGISAEHIELLKNMLSEKEAEKDSIYKQIEKLRSRKGKRKNSTFYMDESLSATLREYANARELSISDVLEIFIIEGLKRFE